MHYGFAVFSTSRGGLVRRYGTTFIFVVAPKAPSLHLEQGEAKNVGDVMPDGWTVTPENKLAEQDIAEHPGDFRSVLD